MVYILRFFKKKFRQYFYFIIAGLEQIKIVKWVEDDLENS